MEQYVDWEERQQYQANGVVSVSFLIDGEKKTFESYEAGVITCATIAMIPGPGQKGSSTLAYYQDEVFDLGTSPQTAAALMQFLTGLDSTRISNRLVHHPGAKKGIYAGQPLAGLYLRWNQILSADEPLHYVKAAVKAKIAKIHNDRYREPTFVSPSDALAPGRAVQQGALLRKGNNWWGIGALQGEAFEVAERMAIGVAPDEKGLIGSIAGEAATELSLNDYEGIISQLEALGEDKKRTAARRKRDKRTAGLLRRAILEGKKAPNGADGDYMFLQRQFKNPQSTLCRLIAEAKTQIEMEDCTHRIISVSAGTFLAHPMHHYGLNSGRIYSLAAVKEEGTRRKAAQLKRPTLTEEQVAACAADARALRSLRK